jgi:hypothetical protein
MPVLGQPANSPIGRQRSSTSSRRAATLCAGPSASLLVCALSQLEIFELVPPDGVEHAPILAVRFGDDHTLAVDLALNRAANERDRAIKIPDKLRGEILLLVGHGNLGKSQCKPPTRERLPSCKPPFVPTTVRPQACCLILPDLSKATLPSVDADQAGRSPGWVTALPRCRSRSRAARW